MKSINKNIVLIGMPGSGKTTIGKILAEKLKMSFIDLDQYIEEFSGETIAEIFKKGEDCFRDIETSAINSLYDKEDAIISTGGGVIKRKENISSLQRKGIIIFIDRPIEEIAKDVDIGSRPLLAGGVERIYELYKERYDLYKEYCDIIVDNTGDIEAVANHIIKLIEKYIFKEGD